MTDETRVALMNYEHLIRVHGPAGVRMVWTTDTLLFGAEGHADVDMLTRPGFTPATECFARVQERDRAIQVGEPS